MAGYELATAYVTLAVESSRIPEAIGAGFAGADKIAAKSGKTMGKAMGDAFSKEKGPDFDKLADDAAKADKRVQASAEQVARKRSDAARQVEIAEQKVLETREKSIARDRDVVNAEKQLAAARKQGDPDAAAAAEDRLARAREAATPTSADMAAEDRLTKAKRSYIDVSRDGVQTLSRFAKEQDQANTKLKEARRAADDADRSTEKAAGAFARMGDRVKSAMQGDFKGAFRRVERDGEGAAKEIERDFKRSGNESARGFGSNFKTGLAGALGGLTAYVGLSEVLDLGKFAVSGAADLEQSIGGVQTVFKDSANQMLAWSEAADQSLGLTENEYNEFAARLGASLKNAGTPMDQLGGKTNDLIAMGADLASLYGGTTAEAVDALGSALRGEMDPIERYGISLNDAALTAEGLAMGIKKTGGSFSTQEKQLISMSLLQKQSADATGNFAREQDTASNVAQRLTAKLKETATEVGGRLTPFLTDLGSWFLDKGIPALEGFGKGVEGVWSILSAGDFKGAENTFGLDEDSPAIGALFSIRDAGIELYEKALKPLGAFVADNLVPILATLGAAFAGWKIATIVTAISSAIAAGGGLVAVFSTVVAAIGWIPLAIGAAVGALVWFFTATETGKNLVAGAWSFIRSAISGVVSWFQDTAMPALAAGWDVLQTVALAVWDGVLKPVFTAIGSLAQQIFNGVVLPALQQFGGYITGTVWPMIQKLWTDYIQPVFTLIGGLAIWLWNNAIKPAVTAITHYWQNILGPVIAWLWKSVISPAFTAIGAVISFAVNNVIFPVLDLLKGFLVNVIAPAMVWLWQNVLVPAWDGISTAIGAVVGWLVNTAWPAIKGVWDAIATAATWLWRNVISPVWDGIRLAIAVAVTGILVYIDLLKWYWQSVIAPVAMWLWNTVIKPVWSGIQSAIGAVVTWFTGTAWPILKAAWNAVAAAAMWLWRNVLQPAWNGIRSAISAVVTWFRDTAWPLLSSVIGWIATKFDQFKLGLSIIWSFIRDNVIGPVVSWFRDTVWPIFSSIIGQIRDRFSWFRDRLGEVWSFIRDSIINPVVNWFADTVKPKIDDFIGKVKDGFTNLKDGILKAWDGIRDGLKKPINGMIGIYNDHIAGNFNKAIDTVFGKDGGEKYRLKPMSEFHTGGYTGPGGKYQPAGVVHADEFVIRKESQNSLRRDAPGFLDALNTHGARALSGMGFGYAGGGKVLNSWQSISRIPHEGMRIASTVRSGARTAGSGSVSKHAQGLAVDFAGAAGAMRSFFNFVRDNYSVSELIHTPMGGRQLSRGGIPRANFSAATARGHYDHVHVGGWGPGEKAGAGAFAGASTSGSAEGSWLPNPFDGLWGTIKDKVAGAVGGGMVGGLLSKVAENTVGGLGDWVSEKIGAVTDVVGDAAGAARWTPTATLALTREGEMSGGNLASLLRRMNQESGYNPRAVNNWDSNARKGTPSKGLMQVIQPTFNAYRDKSLSSDIYDPLANIVASIRYAKAQYGSVKAAYDRSGGYAGGGWTGPGGKSTPAGVVHADEFVVQKSSRRSIESARPGFLDALNRHGASALAGYASGGLVGYASGGTVSPNAKIGSSKVTVILDGLLGTEKQVKAAAGKLADGISKTFQDRFKAGQKQQVTRLSDSLKALKNQASQLNKTMSTRSSAAKKSTVNRLSDDLTDLRKKAKALDPKKQASQLAAVRKQIESTQSALTKARRGDYSSAAAATAAKLKDVQKQIASTEAALKAARSGNTSVAATKAAEAFFTRYAASATTKLQGLAKRSDELTAKLKTANSQLTEAIKVRNEYTTSMTEKFAGAYALTGDSATTGIETIIRGFRDAAATVSGFSGQLAALKSRGLSVGLLDQIAQLGAVDGSKVARNLLTGSTAQIKQITAQYNALNKASAASGSALGRQMHQAGVNTAQGYVNGLSSQLAAVTKASEKLADQVVSTVRRKLGIRSPSRVAFALAEFFGEGWVNGVTSQIPAASRAMDSLTAPPDLRALEGLSSTLSQRPGAVLTDGQRSAMASPAVEAGAGGRGGVTITGGQFGYSPDEIARGIRRRQKKDEALHIY